VYRSLWYIWVFGSSARRKNDGASLSPSFKELCFGQSRPGNVGLRNMLNAACSVRQGQQRCFTEKIAAGPLSGGIVTDTSGPKWIFQ
jgi:hypothetical protein